MYVSLFVPVYIGYILFYILCYINTLKYPHFILIRLLFPIICQIVAFVSITTISISTSFNFKWINERDNSQYFSKKSTTDMHLSINFKPFRTYLHQKFNYYSIHGLNAFFWSVLLRWFEIFRCSKFIFLFGCWIDRCHSLSSPFSMFPNNFELDWR